MSYKDDMKRQRKARKRKERKRGRAKPKQLVLTIQSCGNCTACCTCVAVEELRKGYYSPCSFCDGRGCTTYDNRPPSCADYYCAFSAGLVPYRPDQCGTLFSIERMQREQVLSVYEVQPDAFIGKLGFVFEVANRLTQRGVVPHRIVLYRYGAEIPTVWEGQHHRLKMKTWGDPKVYGQLWFTVRTDHEVEDDIWWLQAFGGVARLSNSSEVKGTEHRV